MKYFHTIFGLTVRTYHDGILSCVTGSIFEPDLAMPYISTLLGSGRHVTLMMTRSLHCYGIIRSEADAYVIGPVVRMRPDDIEMKEVALEIGAVGTDLASLRTYLNTLPILSMTKFADILCLINAIINGEVVPPDSILLGDISSQGNLSAFLPSGESEMQNDASLTNYRTEQKLMSLISRGDVRSLREYLMHTQFRQDYLIASDSIRNARNILIVAATLATRAAISGGLAPEKAFALSDLYIRSVETINKPEAIYALMSRMVIDFTERVGICVTPERASPVVASCLRWISRNINQPIALADVAAYANISCGHLSALFRKEVGIPISEYISLARVEEAKRLLVNTTLSLADIAAYLCFSSQSYFQNVFKKHSGMTPVAYRRYKN